ncbi:hypothetical protein Q3A66_18930 [Hymenobacter sp. BT770]|uniref:GumC family protein n=1 Tax=Hymenobacter sp. BT770 TaxID=2886942 RepID=UPI001D10A075|nr:hypothetical protein [Hymenobacter sp. BT770]MCC3155130.1 hypothetical protein [Hymenobacter sp. BT770]MDO3417147.1 hypothetical protein [Hymenobacter sp. BT770]
MRRHWLLLLLVPVTTAGSIYFFSRFQDRKYKSDTVIYTGIASGYKIEGGNNDAGGNWNATSTAFDNLLTLVNSRDTRQEVSLRLLAWRLMQDPMRLTRPAQGVSNVTAAFLEELLGGPTAETDKLLPPRVRSRLTGNTLAETMARLRAAYQEGPRNPVNKLVNSKAPLYSETALEGITASRVKDSDLVQVEYTTTDPVVCQKTLEILTQVFIRKHKELFTGQNETVIGYFDQAAQKAYQRLQAAEQRLLEFHQKHNLVDYDKQILASTDEKQLSADKYNQLEMQYAGAFSQLKSVETTLSKRGVSSLKSQEIIRLRNQLSGLSSQIAELELVGSTVPGAPARLASLKQQAEQLTNKIGDAVNSEYASSHSVQGVNVKDLLGDYTKNALLVEDLKSQLNLMRQQKQTVAGQYNALVPLGAEIRKIRREVEVAEKEYLSQMEGLKQSKLSQQNGLLASQLRVVDPPYLPTRSTGSKLLLLLIGGVVGSFLLTGAGLVTAAMLDTSLQNPAHAAAVTTFPVAGIIPKPTRPSAGPPPYAKRAEDHLARHLLLKFQHKASTDKPYVIGVLSSQSAEGKTEVCSSLAASLSEMGINTLSLFPSDHVLQIMPHDGIQFYSPLQGLTQGVRVEDIATKYVPGEAVIIVEFPALLESTYPASLLQDLDLILVAVRAERSWLPADRQIFQSIRTVTKAPIEIVLNGVLPEYVAEFIGARARPTAAPAFRPALPPHPSQPLLN